MRNRTLLVGLAVAIGLVLLSYLLLFRPQTTSLDDAQKREDAAESVNSELELRLSRLQAVQANEPELRADLESLKTAIPDNPALAQFIFDANDAAQASGVQFLSISPTPPVPDPTTGLSVVQLAIEVTGGYFQTLDYLNRLAAMPRIVVTDSLDLAGGGGADTATLSVSVAARMFTTAVPPEPGTVPTTDPSATTTTTTPGATTTTTAATTTTGGTP